MPWIRRKLRDAIVFAKVDAAGKLAGGKDGRVDVVYALRSGAKIYRASERNLEPTGQPEGDEVLTPDLVEEGGHLCGTDSILVYTDGACSGNPGPMGIGVVILHGKERQEISEFLGTGTNNIAELTAIERALAALPPADRQRPVVIHSDSSYAIGLLTQNWKAKANTELVDRLRALAREFGDLRFVKVKGHSGVPENERCDQLAVQAIERAR